MSSSNSVTISVSCSICGRNMLDNEEMMNPIGDHNWYCIDCWIRKQKKEREQRENYEQILANDSFTKYYLLRARCETCQTKTWHYYYRQSFEWDIIGMREPLTHTTETSACIEHSMADSNE